MHGKIFNKSQNASQQCIDVLLLLPSTGYLNTLVEDAKAQKNLGTKAHGQASF